MTQQRVYRAPNLNMGQLVQALVDWYRAQKFEVQVLDMPGGGVVIQARQPEAWRAVLGMSSALNVVLRRQGEDLFVEIGAGKWVDKAIAGAAGLFVLWPLLFTAAYGAWQQSKLPERTFEFIERFLATGRVPAADVAAWTATQYAQAQHYVRAVQSTVGPTPAPPQPEGAATAAGPQAAAQPGAPEAQPATQAQPAAEAKFCPQCGAAVPPNARFCPQCGTKLEGTATAA